MVGTNGGACFGEKNNSSAAWHKYLFVAVKPKAWFRKDVSSTLQYR